MRKKKKKLNIIRSSELRERRFAKFFLETGNAKRSAMRAGFNVKRASQTGYDLMRRPRVQKMMQKDLKRLRLTKPRVAREVARLALADPKELFDEEGKIKSVCDMDADIAHAIGGISVRRSKNGKELTKVKLCDKNRALDLGARMLGMVQERISADVNVKGGLLVVPATVDLETWMLKARDQQRQLTQEE